MNASISIYFNKQRIKANNTATVYIRIIIERKIHTIKMPFEWPTDLINLKDNTLIPRFKNDNDHATYMALIRDKISKINNIIKSNLLADKPLTLEDLIKQLDNYASRENFVTYMYTKINERYNAGLIRKNTYQSHMSSANTLNQFKSIIPFAAISKNLLEEYKSYMYTRLSLDPGTARTKLKNLRTYLNAAQEESFIFEYPFGKKFKMPEENRRIDYLDEEEFQKLKHHYYSAAITPGTNKHKALQSFLFICYTGVRLGDLQKLTHNNLKKNILNFQISKKLKDKQNTIEIPLHPEAAKLIKTKKGNLIDFPSSETKFRQMMSEISQELNLSINCHPHSGRHTFATRFLRAGGRIEVLKELLGHEDIKTTLIYVHVDLNRKTTEINLMT